MEALHQCQSRELAVRGPRAGVGVPVAHEVLAADAGAVLARAPREPVLHALGLAPRGLVPIACPEVRDGVAGRHERRRIG